MDSLNEFCPTPKRLKPMEPESIACSWDAVNANNLNAELPEELRDISSNECFQSFGNQGIQVPYFQSDYFSTQHPQIEHEGPVKRLQVNLPFAGQRLNSDRNVDLLYSKDVKLDELSGHSTLPVECTNILRKSVDCVIYTQPATDIQRDFKHSSSTYLIPQKIEPEGQPIMTPLIFQMQQSTEATFSALQNDSNYFLVQSGSQKSKATVPRALPSDENKPVDVPLESSLIQNRCLIQKQLILLLHANKCQKGRDADSFCNIPQCRTMKDVLKHLADCKEDNCVFSYCASSRQIIKHWKQCSNNQCAVCQPLKLACEKKNASLLSKNLTTTSSLPSRSSFVRLGNSAGLPTSTYSLGSNSRSTAAVTPNQCLENAGHEVKQTVFSSDKSDWHQSFGKEMRDSVVYKLMKCLYPSCGSLSLNELTNIILCIKKLESGVFEKASSKEEYYNILSAKIQAIKNDSEQQQRETSKVLLQKSMLEIQANSPFLGVADAQLKSKTQGVARETSGDLKEMSLDVSNYNTSTGCKSDSTISTKLVSFSKEKSYSEELNPNSGVSSSLSIQEAVKTSNEATDSLVDSSSDVIVSTSSNLKVWRKDELRSFLLPILMELYRTEPESLPFRRPVDPVLEGVPEYLEVIKKPMDLSTIKNKLENGAYDQPWAFIDDMWQIFENAWVFNKKGSRVHRHCTKLCEMFDAMANDLMKKLGYCCGHKYMYTPIVLVCYGKFTCNIPINAVYYTYQNRFSYCENCFNSIPGDFINLNEDPGQSTRLMKSYFVKMKNGEFEYEKLVECSSCGRKQHPICCMHLEQFRLGSLKCPSCTKYENISGGIENKFSAKKLPQTYLSSYLESRVNSFIKKSGCDFREVVIRVLSCSEKNVEVKQGMRKAYLKENKNDVAQFPYISKAIFAFMEDGGTEVCFFGMHVHEYDSSCPPPNSRRVYIAYMDSVNFFHPRNLRTSVYHELLIGYLDYVKKIGFAHAHIWVCPPSEGDDYIFNCHPPNMRIPKQKRLQDWYKKLLDKALSENVIYSYKDLLRDLKDRSVTSVTEIPYFDGDYWPSILEEYLKESEEFETQMSRNDDCYDDNDCFEVESEGSSKTTEFEAKKKIQKGVDGKKKKARSKLVRRHSKKANGEFRDVMTRVFASLEKLKEGFFVVNFHPPESERSLVEIKDPDQCILNDLMDGRDSFLTLAREKHFEFSSLRRAKHSTLALLYELHTHGKINFTYSCNACKAIVDNHYHCNVCPDFDLCETCYKHEGHEHAMERFVEFDKKCEENSSATSRNSKNAAMAREMALLIHVFQCPNATCQTSGCHKMKSILRHVKVCKQKNEKTCTTCRHFLALCCCHAKRCSSANCFIPLCDAIKQRFLLQKKLQGKMLKRRMASLRRDVGFSHDYYGSLSSDAHKDHQTLANPVNTDRVDFQHQSSFNGNQIKNLPDKESVKVLTVASSDTHPIGVSETFDSNYGASSVMPQMELPSPHGAMLLINPNNLSTIRGGNQVLNSANPNLPLLLQLQSNHCLLANAQGEILGVVQMPVIQNQQLVNINPSQASQIITSSISSSQASNMTAMSKSSNLSEEYLSHFQSQVNQGGLQLGAEKSNGEKNVMAHSSRSSTSALLTLYKTLKSSPLQQHQQLLNILMNDPLKLAKVIKQKQANKRDAQKSLLTTSSSSNSTPTLPKLVTITTVSNLSTSGYINSQIHLETQAPLSSATCTISYYPSKNEICEQTSLGQHSHNLVFAPANVIPLLNSSLLQGRKLSNTFETSEKINEARCFVNEKKMHRVGVQSRTVVPSAPPSCSAIANDDLEAVGFTEIQTPLKSSDIQQFQEIVRQDPSFNLQEVLNQKSFAKRFPNKEQKSQRCISVSSDVMEKLLIMKELHSQPQATGHSASRLDERPAKTFPRVESNPTTLLVGNVAERRPNSTWIKNVMLSSQFPCNVEVLCDNSSLAKPSEECQAMDGSLQDQLSRYAEEL